MSHQASPQPTSLPASVLRSQWESLIALFAADRDAFYMLATTQEQPDLEVAGIAALARSLRLMLRGTYQLMPPFRGEGCLVAGSDRLAILADIFGPVQQLLLRLEERKNASDYSEAEIRFWGDDPRFFTGLDLGQAQDYSALVTIEVIRIPNPAQRGMTLPRFDVRRIHRWHLGTPYPTIVAETKAWFAQPPLAGTPLIIDRTGVGVAVTDQFRAANLNAMLRPYSITAGREPGRGTVPKAELVGALQTALGTRRLRIAEGLPLAEVLKKELEMFRVKVTADRNETFSARERDHDDVVLSLALACWYASRHSGDLVLSVRDVPLPEKMVAKSGWAP